MTKILVTRSCEINAPADTVLALVKDLKAWRDWSPWQEADPEMHQEHSGPQGEIGSQMSWRGNKQAGSGRMTVVALEKNLVEIDIEFFKPFAARNLSRFVASPSPRGTVLTWSMSGEQSLFMKAVFLCLRMEKSIGRDFERGLVRLKELAENHREVN